MTPNIGQGKLNTIRNTWERRILAKESHNDFGQYPASVIDLLSTALYFGPIGKVIVSPIAGIH